MKKIIGIILIITLVICSSTITLADEAGNISGMGLNQDQTIEVSGQLSESIGTVYSVDISWQSMNFKYITTGARWNPDTHSFGSAEGQWSIFDNEENRNNINTITVTNHSNGHVEATLAYESVQTEPDVGGGFYNSAGENDGNSISMLVVSSAVGTTREGAPKGNAYLRLEGRPSDTWINGSGGILGTITVGIQVSA